MTRILQLGKIIICFLIFALNSCKKEKYFSFSNVEHSNIERYYPFFVQYAKMDSTLNFEENAVLCSIFGDYETALYYATKDASIPFNIFSNMDIGVLDEQIKHAENLNIDDSIAFDKILRSLNRPKQLNLLFKDYNMLSAEKFIIKQAENCHFILLNEAHYNSQNRAFTSNLLEPLWNKGFRYLAIETLGYEDSSLMKRKYPIEKTGFYSKDPVFGNMIRKAIKIGFKLIPYEINISTNEKELKGSLRDSVQAKNIYERTVLKDRKGKVIVHAGYDHVSKYGGSNYSPMGYQLKKLTNKKILAIDQETMGEKTVKDKMHPFYRYVINNYEFDNSIIFTNVEQKILLDDITVLGYDLQIYHPSTIFINHRPNWLLEEENNKIVPIKEVSSYLNKNERYLFRFFKKGENEKIAIPIDQFVYKEGIVAILSPGEYILNVIDLNGTLKLKSNLSIK
jgi:hypothetical protein